MASALQRVATMVSICCPQSDANHFANLAVVITCAFGLPVDAAYTSYYQDSDYPVGKVLRDPVYVEVQLLNKTDPTLVLTLGRCWATTGPNPHSLPQWDILING